jgi:NCAIR mutase (PurE)-related protein
MSEEFELDWNRMERTGFPEIVLCDGKSVAQIDAIVAAAQQRGARLLLTRLEEGVFGQLRGNLRAGLDFLPDARVARLGPSLRSLLPGIGIVTAGTSDLTVALEAAATLEFAGHKAPIIADVGVAGIWRLLARLDEIRRFKIIIAVAGMEGALFSVLAGLVEAPVIAVPTSVGYGVAANGMAALSSALATCTPGVVVVNIDNGVGAAAAATKMIRMATLDSRVRPEARAANI